MSCAVTRTRLSDFADAALQDIANPTTADGSDIHGLPLVGKHRIAGDHEEALEPGQGSGDVLGNPVAESCSGSALMLLNGSTAMTVSPEVRRGPGRRRGPRLEEPGTFAPAVACF